PETPKPKLEKAIEHIPIAETPRSTPAPVVQASQKDELTQEIEEVLSEDLGDLYKNLPPERKKKFKEEGEKTAGLIRQMLTKGKFHGRKVLQLIIGWLKLIPGVNKFFLEQESKIKVDKIMLLAEEERKKRL
ncbi:MAG: hypothetical protein AAB802_00390, partial [Patescibacteria group bacterium]